MVSFRDELDLYQNNEEREAMDQFYERHSDFGLRAKQELKRAERYCEFLSLLVLDLSGLTRLAKRGSLRGYRRVETLLEDIEKVVKDRKSRVVRETDIISRIENQKLLLLLPETPKEGAKVLAKRLGETLKYRISSFLKTPPGWQVPMNILSYPDRKGKERFLGFVQDLVQS